MVKRGVFDDPEDDEDDEDDEVDPVEDPKRELTASQQQQLTTYDEWFRDNPEPNRYHVRQPKRDDTISQSSRESWIPFDETLSNDPEFETQRDWEIALNRWENEKKAWDDWNYANNLYTELREELVNPE